MSVTGYHPGVRSISYGPSLMIDPDLLAPLHPTLESRVDNLHGHVHKRPAPEFGASRVNLSMKMRDYRLWRLGEI